MAEIPFFASDIEGSINNRFKVIVRNVPDRVAVEVLTDRLTYAELDSASDKVEQAILSHPGSNKVEPIALMLDQGTLTLTAILGILKTGRSFIVFPPDTPPERLKSLWEDALHPLMLTNRQNLETTRVVVSLENKWLNIDDIASGHGGEGMLAPEPRPDDLAVISYTSGSTGEPKGVMWSHRLVLHTAFQNQKSYQITPQDRCAVLSSFGFGAAMTQCFAAILSGATLYLPDLKQSNISSLLSWLRREEITIIAMPPLGLFRQLLDALESAPVLSSVRLVILGGDDLFKRDVDRFRTCFKPDASLAYRLAGSETMLIREFHIDPKTQVSTEKIPVGYAVPDKEVLLLDENGHEVPPGEIGEIVVRSRYLASGYWCRPDLTETRFRPDPAGSDRMLYLTGDLARMNPSGQMEHLGRKDFMVKVHGYSVQLEAIDAVMQELTFVKEAVTVAESLPGGDKRLIAYLVSRGSQKPSVSEIREELATHLEDYLIPSAFVWMEHLPRTSTGKLDRQTLPPSPHTRPDIKTPLVVPRTDQEEMLARVWRDLLQLEQVGVEDNFFEIGGDSLLSVQMILEVERLLNLKVSSTYFERPTIEHLVTSLQQTEQVYGTSMSPEVRIRQNKRRKVPKWYSMLRSIKYKLAAQQLTIASILRGIQKLFSETVLGGFEWIYKGMVLQKPYPEGIRRLERWTRLPLVAKGLYRTQYNQFNRLVASLDGCNVDAGTVFNANLNGNVIHRLYVSTVSDDDTIKLIDRFRTSDHLFWRSLAQLIDEAPFEELDRWFSVSGFEHLEQAYRKSRGVILLTYHSSSNRLAIAALPRRLAGEYIPTISYRVASQKSPDWEKTRGKYIPKIGRAAFNAEIALHGQRYLEQGKIIQLVSDLEDEKVGYQVVLGGRQYYLGPGFAELACNTGATVIPQYTSWGLDGHIHTTFLPPLDPGTGNRDARINALMEQYVDFINLSWRTVPESLRWLRIKTHFRQPRVTPVIGSPDHV